MRYIVIATLIACLVLAVLASMARAHDFYPIECCSGQDCAPVEKVEMVAGATFAGALGFVPALPVMVVTTKHGTAAVPPNLMPKQSPDAQMHACVHLGKLICLFLPPTF